MPNRLPYATIKYNRVTDEEDDDDAEMKLDIDEDTEMDSSTDLN